MDDWDLRTMTSERTVDGLCPFTPHREDRADAESSQNQIYKQQHANGLEHFSHVKRKPQQKAGFAHFGESGHDNNSYHH